MATTINDVRGMENPQRAYEYEVEIYGSSVAGSIPILTQRVESVQLPSATVETIEINFKGRKTIHAGRDGSSHIVTVSFYDDESREVYKFFKNWMDGTISDPIVGGGLTRDLYAGEMFIRTYAHDSQTVTATHKLTKVFPTEIGEVQLNYESSESLRWDVTFSYDTHEMI